MTRKRRASEFDAPAQALGFADVDALIRQRMLDGHRRMDIAAELGCHINVISKRIFAHNPDLASGPDGLDRRHHFVVARYKAGETVAEIGRIDKIGERRVAKILKAEETRTGETVIRPTANRNQAAAKSKPAAPSEWNNESGQRKPPRKIRETALPCGWQRGDEPVILTIVPGELWCKCGTVAYKGNCPRCEGDTLIPAVQILRPGEYRLARMGA